MFGNRIINYWFMIFNWIVQANAQLPFTRQWWIGVGRRYSSFWRWNLKAVILTFCNKFFNDFLIMKTRSFISRVISGIAGNFLWRGVWEFYSAFLILYLLNFMIAFEHMIWNCEIFHFFEVSGVRISWTLSWLLRYLYH